MVSAGVAPPLQYIIPVNCAAVLHTLPQPREADLSSLAHILTIVPVLVSSFRVSVVIIVPSFGYYKAYDSRDRSSEEGT